VNAGFEEKEELIRGSARLDYYHSVGLKVGSKHLITYIVNAYLEKDSS